MLFFQSPQRKFKKAKKQEDLNKVLMFAKLSVEKGSVDDWLTDNLYNSTFEIR